jgi:hypothetical protein
LTQINKAKALCDNVAGGPIQEFKPAMIAHPGRRHIGIWFVILLGIMVLAFVMATVRPAAQTGTGDASVAGTSSEQSASQTPPPDSVPRN